MTKFNIKIAQVVKYGRLKSYRTKAEMIKKIIHEYENVISSMLDLPDEINVELCSMRDGSHGGWFNGSKRMKLSVARSNVDDIFSTFFHELVHAEQYKQKRLTRELVGNHFVYCWNGTPSVRDTPKDYEAYRNLPWEKEAFRRQTKLVAGFIKLITQ